MSYHRQIRMIRRGRSWRVNVHGTKRRELQRPPEPRPPTPMPPDWRRQLQAIKENFIKGEQPWT